MILNKNIPTSWNSGMGEGRAITPHALLWRSVIVRAVMDALDIRYSCMG